MSASANDKFMKAGAGTVTTLSAPGKALSATSITVGSTTNYPTDTGIVFAIRQVDVNGELVTGTYTEWAGTVTSGTTLSMDAAPVYGSDQVYPAGSTTQVYIPLSSSAHNKMVDGLLVSHDQDGTLKADIVETPNIKDDAVTAEKIDFPSYVSGKHYGYVKLGSNTTSSSATTVILSLSGTNMIVGGVYQVEATVMGAPNVTTDYDMYIRANGGVVVENIATVSPNWGSVPLSCQFTYASGDVQLTGNSSGKTIHANGTTLKYRLVG